jgi:hypothetical protein
MNRERTDPAAETRLRTEFGHQVVKALGEHDYAVRFERRVNEQGVAVRRVVVYGPEDCDPDVPAVRHGQKQHNPRNSCTTI